MSSLPSNIEWALSKNPHNIKGVLLLKYALGHGYWNYLDDLISDLLKGKCKGIQEKIADVDSFNKFESAWSELEIARLFCAKGKQIELLPDAYLGVAKSPDILVMDSAADSYIEVARFNEDDLLTIILDELRQFLRSQSTPYLVDVDIPDVLSVPVTGYRSMQERKDTANRIMKEFQTKFSSPPPAQIAAGNVTFTISNSSTGTCGPGLVNSAAIEVPSHLYISRIRYLVTSKAIKRESWTGDDLKKRYVIAIDTEQSYLDEEDVAQAVLGARVTDRTWPLPEVEDAAKKGWVTYLEKEHLITKDRTYLASRGVFLSDPLCKNVSGVIVRKSSNVWFYPNPFSADEINDPNITHLLD